MLPARALLGISALPLLVGCGAAAGPRVDRASAAPHCDRVAAQTGSDGASGTLARPFRSLGKLTGSLQDGQTGCLRGGTWNESLYVDTPNVTITSYPGERAKVVGLTSIGGNGDGATVQDLNLVGKDVSPTVFADNATFRGNDVTNSHRGRTCFLVGDHGSPVSNTRIEANRIHDCGRLPATNMDPGIYVLNSSGAVITLNVIYRNADWGVQLYPDARDTVVSRNVIDGNGKGVTFGGDDSTASQGNVVKRNVISNPALQDNLQSYWGSAGTWSGGDLGNVVRANCLWDKADAAHGGVNTRYGGFKAVGNTIADPRFVDRAAGDYRLRARSRCKAVAGDPAADAKAANSQRTARRSGG